MRTKKSWLIVVGLAGIGLPACGEVCGDDGFSWQQKDNPACMAASAGNTEANTDSATDSATDSDPSPTNDTPSSPTESPSGGMSDSESNSNPDTDTDSATESASDPTSDTDTDSASDPTNTTGPGGANCADEDGDGFGDPLNCMDQPFPGSVPNDDDCDDGSANTFPGSAELDSADACMADEDGDGYGDDTPGPGVLPGTDCDDGGANTFPGSAPLDDPDACMKDEDNDDHGDSMPPDGVTPGTDCADEDASILMCTNWCVDGDGDGQGDPGMCTGVPEGEMPPDGTVPNADDCVDDNPDIYEGAAEQEPDLCTLDADDDGYGDDKVEDTFPGAENGTDCLDSDANAFPGAAELDMPDVCALDSDNDGWGDDMPPAGVTPGRDCDDTAMNSVVCVEVNPSCTSTNLGMGTQFTAIASGGDGNYTYMWDHPESLSDVTIPDPIATPDVITTYTVDVSDGSSNTGSAKVTVHLDDKPWALNGPDAECMAYGFVGAPAPHNFANMNTTTCTTGNTDPTAYVCQTVHQNARITGTMIVNPPVDDDDWIGFVWGWQNTDQYYLMHWKQAAQNVNGCMTLPGMTVKRIDRTQAYTLADFSCPTTTPNATVLLTPAQTTNVGWVHGVAYDVELLYSETQTEITITQANNNMVIANFIVNDATYPSGQFGTYDYSQIRACNGPWNSSCL